MTHPSESARCPSAFPQPANIQRRSRGRNIKGQHPYVACTCVFISPLAVVVAFIALFVVTRSTADRLSRLRARTHNSHTPAHCASPHARAEQIVCGCEQVSQCASGGCTPRGSRGVRGSTSCVQRREMVLDFSVPNPAPRLASPRQRYFTCICLLHGWLAHGKVTLHV